MCVCVVVVVPGGMPRSRPIPAGVIGYIFTSWCDRVHLYQLVCIGVQVDIYTSYLYPQFQCQMGCRITHTFQAFEGAPEHFAAFFQHVTAACVLDLKVRRHWSLEGFSLITCLLQGGVYSMKERTLLILFLIHCFNSLVMHSLLH